MYVYVYVYVRVCVYVYVYIYIYILSDIRLIFSLDWDNNFKIKIH